ncbi:hypothetical protein ACS0TY_012145 [Phlomoides rotata]
MWLKMLKMPLRSSLSRSTNPQGTEAYRQGVLASQSMCLTSTGSGSRSGPSEPGSMKSGKDG